MLDIPTQMQHLQEGRLSTHGINVSFSLEEKQRMNIAGHLRQELGLKVISALKHHLK